MKCHCGGAMKPLFTSWFCPACDERKAKYEAAYKEEAETKVDVDAVRELMAKPRIWMNAPPATGPSAYGPTVAPPAPARVRFYTQVAPGGPGPPPLQQTTPVPWDPSQLGVYLPCLLNCGGYMQTIDFLANKGRCRNGHVWSWSAVP